MKFRKVIKTISIILLMIISVIACIAGMVVVFSMIEHFIAPEGWLFYEHDPRLQAPMTFLVFAPMLFFIVWILRKVFHMSNEILDDYFYFVDFGLKYKAPFLAVWVLAFYLCFSNMTFVTADEIICYSPQNPLGERYSYEQVEKAEASFGKEGLLTFDYEECGNFSYTIYMDGRKEIFSVPNVNEDIQRYYDDTYLELEEFDQKIVEAGAVKVSDDSCAEDCVLDQEYVDRFMRIIANK